MTYRPDDDSESAREAAKVSLAKELYFTMERFDPDGFDWDRSLDANWIALSDRERDFYVHAVRSLLSCKREILIALGDGAARQ